MTQTKEYSLVDQVSVRRVGDGLVTYRRSPTEYTLVELPLIAYLRDELGYHYSVALHTSIPDDATGREARELVRGLGGLVMKNGAMAMAMMHGHDGTISL